MLNQSDPAPPSSDGWLGNKLIDPGKGKQWCAGPEIRLGRPNLFPLMQQVGWLSTLYAHQGVHPSEQISHKAATLYTQGILNHLSVCAI